MPKRVRESETPFSQLQQQPSSSSQTLDTFIAPPSSNPIARGKKPYTSKDGGFQQDIIKLMKAFGDVSPPLSSSVSILEEITLDYLTDLIHRSRPSPYSLPISSSKFNPNHPLNHILDSDFSTSSTSSSGIGNLNGNPDPLNAPTGRSGYAYPPRAKIQPDDIRRSLRKLAPKPIKIKSSKVNKKRRTNDDIQDHHDDDGDGEEEEEEEEEEAILNRPLERLEEVTYLKKMIDLAQKSAAGEDPKDLAHYAEDDGKGK